MRTWVTAAAIVAALALTNIAHAAAGWTASVQVTELNQQPGIGAGASLVFIETTAATNPSGCSHSAGFYFDPSDARRARLFAMLLAAHVAAKPVKVYTTGTCHLWGYAELDGLVVVQ